MDLSDLPVLDGHAHPVLRPEHVEGADYAAFFTEGTSGPDARETLFFRRSLRDLGELLGCEPGEVEARRAALGLDDLASRCLSGFEALLLDDGLTPGRTMPLDWHGRFSPVRRVLRLETLAESLAGGSFRGFIEQFRAELEATEAAGFKTIAAYRGGLQVKLVQGDEAAESYRAFRKRLDQGPPRLGDRPEDLPLRDHLLGLALAVAARRGLPVQVHTGFGDADLDLPLANPAHLRTLLEHPVYRKARVVLLHAWPYPREAAWLASVYPRVYADFGLAVPFLSVRGMVQAVRSLLETAPLTKVLFSTDASRIPEIFWLGRRWGSRVLARVLEEAVADGDLTAAEADRAAEGLLAGNARSLYGL